MSLRGRSALVVRVAILVVLVAGIGAGIVGVRRFVDTRMAEVRDSLMTYLQIRLGRTITYGQVSPSVFRQIAITDLRIYSASDPTRVVLSVDRLRASYSVLRLLLSRDPLQSLREINLSDSSLTLDYEADREIFRALADLLKGSQEGQKFRAPPALRVTGSELAVRFASRSAALTVSRLFFAVSSGDKWLTLSLRCGVSGQLTVSGPLAGTFEATVSASGKAGTDLSWADLTLQLRSLAHERLTIRDQTFLLSYRDNVLQLTKIEDRAPVDLEITLGTESRTARLTFRTDSLRLSDLVGLRGDWKQYSPWLADTVSARGTVTVNLDGTGLAYDGEVQTVLTHPSLPAPVSLEARLRGDARILEVQGLSARSSAGSLTFDGDLELATLLPRGTLAVAGLEGLLGRRVAGAFSIERTDAVAGRPRRLHLAAEGLEIGSLSLVDLRADVDVGKDKADVTLTAAATPLPGAAGTPRAAVRGSVSWSPRPRITATGTVAGFPIGSLVSLLQPGQERSLPREVAAMEASGPLSLDTDLTAFTLELPALSMVDPANAANHARGVLSVANDGVTARSLDVSYMNQTLTGSGDVTLRGGRAVAFKSAVVLNGVPFSVDGSLDGNDLRFTGSYGIQGALRLFPSETGRPDMFFSIRSGAMPVPVKGLSLTATLNLSGAFPDGEEWFVTSTGSHVSFRVPDSNATVQADTDFVLNKGGVTFERIAVGDSFSTVSGTGTLSFLDLAKPSFGVSLKLRAAGGAEQYTVDGTLSPSNFKVRVDGTGSPLARLGQKLVTGSFRGTATISGTPTAPQLDASFSLENGRFNRDPVSLAADLSVSSSHFGLDNVRFVLGDQKVTEGRAAIDLGTGAFSLSGLYDAVILNDKVKTRIGASGSLPGYRLVDVLGLAFPDSMDAVLSVSQATVNSVSFPPWSVQFRTQADTITFRGGPGGMLDGKYGRDRRIAATLKAPFPIVGSVAGTLEGSKLNVNLAVERFDIPVLSTLLKSDIIKFTHGTAAGNVTIYGPLNDPDIVGSVRVSGAAVRSPMSPDEATGINTYVSFGPGGTNVDDKVFVLDAVTAPMGKGKVTAAARFTLDHWTPTAFDLRLTAEPPDGLHVVWRFGTLAVDGFVRGTMRVLYDGTGTKVSSSDLVVQSSKLRMDFSDTGASEGGDPYPLGVDVRVTTGRNVQFSWPAQTFPILKATARQGSSVAVRYDGERGDLMMTGDVAVLGGDMFFFDRSFSIKEGTIAFQEDKLQFDPRVSLRAEIRERDAENRDIRIYLDADRVRLSQLSTQTIRFSSDPALPSAVILERIGQSIASRTIGAGVTSASGTAAIPLFASLTGDVISQVGLLSPVEDRVRDFLGLDLLSIRTQLVQNFLIDKILSQGSALDNNGPALGKYFGNTELTIGKYIGEDLFLEAMLRLQTADAGGNTGIVGLTGLSPAFEVNLEWDTPFFILDWSFLPSHPESLFLSDNTLGIRWRFRY